MLWKWTAGPYLSPIRKVFPMAVEQSLQTTTPQLLDGTWHVDPKPSQLTFKVRSVFGLVPVRGSFNHYEGELQVDGGNGVPVPVAPANIHDSQGVQVTTLSMTVKLDPARPLVIAPLVSSLLDLDFNLAASNLVDMSTPASPIVTVNPLLVATIVMSVPARFTSATPVSGASDRCMQLMPPKIPYRSRNEPGRDCWMRVSPRS